MTITLERARHALAGRYRVERVLGEGGMATVFLAHDGRHERPVALKVLGPDLAVALGPERFLREIQIAANLAHPHIVPLHDSGEADGLLYYVMPYIEGETLGSRLRRNGGLPEEEAVRILREVADALAFAHSRGVVHRDIKPDNVMLTDRHAMVTDFGIAKAVTGAVAGEGITTVGVAIGTPAYMAPEQAAADPSIDHRADIYALGALAYELLAGRTPFAGTAQAILAAHVTREPDPISHHCQRLSAELASVVMRCLAKDPADRWQSAEELWARFDAAARTTGGLAPANGLPAADRRSIVVLPFANLSPDADNEYFSDGLTEEIMADLSEVEALRVISRTSAMQLKGTTKDVRTIGRELGVGYVLEGSVRKAGASLRITAQLIDAATDSHLWAGKYGGTLDDVFALQERVSREIVKALDVTLSSDEDRRLAAHPIADVRAFELYLEARQEVRRYSPPERVFALLQRAIAIEGETPALRALRGWAMVTQVRSGVNRDLRPLEEAEAEARAVLQVAPHAPYGHALLGYIEYERGRLPRSVRHILAALERDPTDAEMLFYLGIVYIAGGQNAQGQATGQRLLAADPLSPFAWSLSALALWFDGQAKKSPPAHRRALELDPQNLIWRWTAGYNCALIGDLSGAALQARWLEEHGPAVPYTIQLRALLAALSGDSSGSLELVGTIDPAPLDAHNTFHLAEPLAMAGDTDRALDLVERAVASGFHPYAFLAEHCPFLAPLRGSPRFENILAEARQLTESFAAAVGAQQ